MSARSAVLLIAAADSSGGAGLTRDVETLTQFHLPVRCAVTAVTVQTDAEVRAIHHVPAELVRAQIRAALECGPVGAIKIGMLGTLATVQAVAESLPSRERIPIVLDPVLAATSGRALLDADGIELLCTLLLRRVTLLTPNIPEAAALLGQAPAQDEPMRNAQLQRLLALGPRAVLLKGGHASGATVTDSFAAAGEAPVQLTVARIQAQRRGTGCSLSSAIAAQLTVGTGLLDACIAAQTYVAAALRRGA